MAVAIILSFIGGGLTGFLLAALFMTSGRN